MSLAVDLEMLGKLATTLHGLAQEAGGIKGENPPDAGTTDRLVAANAAASITTEVVIGALVAAAKTRLDETGSVMTDCATAFKNMDDSNADALVTAYNTGTGDWVVETAL